MARLTQEQRIEIVHTQVPKNYAAFCQKPLRWYMGAALVNAVWLVDPTGGSSLTLGTMLSLIIQSAYLIHFRSQVIVPFRLTYNLPRKLVSSWTLGLAYAAIYSCIRMSSLLPFGIGAVLSALGGAALIGANTFVAYRYHQWQFSRQYANQSLHPVEWVVMACVTGGAMIIVVVACILLYQVGLFVENIVIGIKGCL